MKLRLLITFCLAVALPAWACAAPEAASKPAAEEFHRVELKPTRSQGGALPYTIEVPVGWEVREIEGFPGLWLGPQGATPPKTAQDPQDPRLIWIHGSMVSMDDPEKLVANIKATDAEKAEWSAPRVEVKDVGGLKGLLVRMDAGEGDQARSNLTLKLPLQKLAIDFVATASRADFEKNLPLYERILMSVRPAEPAKP